MQQRVVERRGNDASSGQESEPIASPDARGRLIGSMNAGDPRDRDIMAAHVVRTKPLRLTTVCSSKFFRGFSGTLWADFRCRMPCSSCGDRCFSLGRRDREMASLSTGRRTAPRHRRRSNQLVLVDGATLAGCCVCHRGSGGVVHLARAAPTAATRLTIRSSRRATGSASQGLFRNFLAASEVGVPMLATGS